MRNFIIIILSVIILNGVLLYSGGFAYIKDRFTPEPPDTNLTPDVVDTFRATIEKEVRDKIGMPIEGYEPQMYLDVFPGLAATDFDGVEASIGKYVLIEGQLEHQMGEVELVHSAAGAISRKGVETLYSNIADRTGIDIKNDGTLTDVMKVLTD